MSSSVDFKVEKIIDYLYRKRNKISKDVTVTGRRRAFQFELTLSKSDYTTVLVNGSRSYILSMPKNSMLPEDENLTYIKDMPFAEKMAFIDAWGEIKMRLNRKIIREGNLGLIFGDDTGKKNSSAKK